MKSIQEIYKKLSDLEILEFLTDMENCENNGSFPDDSIIRKLCKQTTEITGLDVSSNLLMVQMGVLKEAAYRYKYELEMKLLDRDDLDINLNNK